MNDVSWNPQVQLIISDVDETIADLYLPAQPQMAAQLASLLSEGKALILITGQGVQNVHRRVVQYLPRAERRHVLVGHCSGAEVWGYDEEGNLQVRPYYSLNALTDNEKECWRAIVRQPVDEFGLRPHPTMPVAEFLATVGPHPLDVMLEDRGPQVTLEVVNGYDLSPARAAELERKIPRFRGVCDMRLPLLERAQSLFNAYGLPLSARLAGVFALDLALVGASKTMAVKQVLAMPEVLGYLGLTTENLANPRHLEVRGDKFSVVRGGTDRHRSEALPEEVRSIDFREEPPEEFPEGYNIVIWRGRYHLHHGLLEYLQAR